VFYIIDGILQPFPPEKAIFVGFTILLAVQALVVSYVYSYNISFLVSQGH
jgi:hypothetical protein